MTPEEILDRITMSYIPIVNDWLEGIYLHGSLAFGCFQKDYSDIDFLVVVKRKLSLAQKKAMISVLCALEPFAPKKGLEMSVVLAEHCKPFVHPMPYELHYSRAYCERAQNDLEAFCLSMNGTDRDLAAHVTVLQKAGFCYFGTPIAAVFGEVPHEAYWDSLLYDIENADETICQEPISVILNLCRVLAYHWDGLVLSKKEGGEWALAQVPQGFHAVIRQALDAYGRHLPYEPDENGEKAFAAYMLEKIHKRRPPKRRSKSGVILK